MCGIAGILQLGHSEASRDDLGAMSDAIAHRGPDGQGLFLDGSYGVAHRRLAILDPTSAGRQPMHCDAGRYVLSYNGEVYNFRELRQELEVAGYRFWSDTDSEVVLKALVQWGDDALLRFNGMFAFALWDREQRELLLARDRYGIKPLYYALCGESLLFGSEVKAIQVHSAFHTRIDCEGLVEYLTFQNFFTDRTLYKDVRLLPPATWLRVGCGKEYPRTGRYWDFHFVEPESPRDHREYAEELDRLFLQAVKRQLVSDVELAAYLSGGMDSGSITAVAASQIPNLKSFTVGFDLTSASGLEKAYDERRRAEHLSYCFQTEHYEMVLKAGDMERAIAPLCHHLEEPRVGQSYPNYYAARLASKFVKVVLAGTGGDELFGGYPWRYYRIVNSASFEEYVDDYYRFWQRLMSNTVLRKVLAPIWDEVEHVWTRDIFRDVFSSHAPQLTAPEDYVNHSLYLEAKTFLHGLLVVEDKISMAHGLETRVPFLDNDLVDFAMRLPVCYKLRNLDRVLSVNENETLTKYYRRSNDGKLLLREVMQRHVPESTAQLEKQGFSAPDASWFKGESIDYVKRRLLRPDAACYSLLDRAATEEVIQEHLAGTQNRRLFIWSLLYLEEWLQQNEVAMAETPPMVAAGRV